jgi:predicted ATP-binding protein involved in virulence
LSILADEKYKSIYDFRPEYNEKRDSVVFWAPDSSYHIDTLKFMIQNDTFPLDTIEISFKKEVKTRGLQLKNNLAKKVDLALGKNLILSSNIPIISVNKEKVHLFRDTVPIEFLISENKAGKEIEIIADWKPDKNYTLVTDSASFTDLNGRTNDSTFLTLHTLKEEYYGSLEINLDIDPADGILIIMDETNKVKEEIYLASSNSHYFQYMEPGKYKLKYITDDNSNRKWDSGNYLKSVHAERVHIYQGTITVRSNWDQAIEWKLN